MTSYAETALIRSLSWLSQAQQAITHNIANASSNGFKRRQPIAETEPTAFQSALQEAMPVVRYREAADWKTGNLLPSSDRNQVALESQDFFRVRAADGRTFFTRSGELQVDAQGYLCDAGGSRYLDSTGNDLQARTEGEGPSGVGIAPNGDLSDDRTGTSLGRALGVFRVADRDALVPAGHGHLVDSANQEVVAVPTTAIRQGNIEASNVETVSELVNMMIVQRTFEANSTVLRHIGQLQSTFINAVTR